MTRAHRIQLALGLVLLAGFTALLRAGDERARGEPIRIAFAGPTSGPSADDGQSAVRAIELVLDRVNAQGGVDGRPVELDVYDDRNDPERARANASSIAEDRRTAAVIGHNFSTCSIAAGEIYAARGVPAVASAATSVAVTRDNDWYFRTIYNDRAQGRFLVLYVRDVLGADGFGIVHESQEYGAYLGDVMQEAAAQAELRLTRRWEFDPSDPGLDARLDAIARQAWQETDVLVLAMQPEAGVKLVRRLRERGFGGELVVSDALASQAFFEGLEGSAGRDAGEGIHASTPFLFDTAGRLGGEFMRDYVSRYDRAPDWYGAFAADAASVLVEAMRRAGISPRAQSIDDDRARLRDALAAIGPRDPVGGITGPTWFDAAGDAQKPVPMGRLVDGELLSAFTQLRLLPGVRRPEDLPETLDPARMVRLGDRFLYRTDVARLGVRARSFGALDFGAGTFEIDFDIWFRHRGDRAVEDVEFTNAVEPLALGEPLDELVEEDLTYRLYRVRGVFRADTLPAPYSGHTLALSFHHRERTRDDLTFAVDALGMNLGSRAGRTERGAPARDLLGAQGDWSVDDVIFFQTDAEEPALGHPSYLTGERPVRVFSQLTVGITLRPQTLGLARLVPDRYRPALLGLAVVASGVLLFASGGRFPRLRWLLQAIFALLLLLVAEPLLGSWLRANASAYHAAQLGRTFEVLWWVVPAVLVNVAIDRFVWTPAATDRDHGVPTVLRYFVAFVVYMLAFFGIVAFVYDYRLTGLLATSGVLAMIVGLAVQLNITNIFAGVALNLERPFRVGDWVMIHGRTPDPENGVIGMVIDINWRTTRLRTADDTEIVIPNGVISEKTITNFMAPHEMSRFELYFNVDQSKPPDVVIPVIQKALDDVIGVENNGPLADPAPSVRITRPTDRGIEYVVRYRIVPREVSPHKARHTINSSVIRRLREAGIELAYPHRTIREEKPATSDA